MLNKQILNAALLLKELKNNPGIKLREFSENYKLSKTFMEQTGRRLVKAKIIKSQRGPGGGYTLNREVVTLAELLKIFKTIKSKDPLVLKAMIAMNNINVLE